MNEKTLPARCGVTWENMLGGNCVVRDESGALDVLVWNGAPLNA